METLKDVLLYLAAHAPAHPDDTATMQRLITEHFDAGEPPAEDSADQPAGGYTAAVDPEH